jgi:hypothetical protein
MEACGYQCACVWRPEAPGVPQQGLSGSPTRNIRFPESSLWLLTADDVLIKWCHYRNSHFVTQWLTPFCITPILFHLFMSTLIYLYRWLYIVNMVQLRIEAFRHLYSPISLYCPWRRKLQNIMYCCLLFPGRYDGLKTMQLNYILYC